MRDEPWALPCWTPACGIGRGHMLLLGRETSRWIEYLDAEADRTTSSRWGAAPAVSAAPGQRRRPIESPPGREAHLYEQGHAIQWSTRARLAASQGRAATIRLPSPPMDQDRGASAEIPRGSLPCRSLGPNLISMTFIGSVARSARYPTLTCYSSQWRPGRPPPDRRPT